MSKSRSTVGTAAQCKVPVFASVKDMGAQLANEAQRGKDYGHACLSKWPALRDDMAKSDADGWAQFKAGAYEAYDASPKHGAPWLVRGERGEYMLVPPAPSAPHDGATRITTGYLRNTTRAEWGKMKNDAPSMYAALAGHRDVVQRFVADAVERLKINVRSALKDEADGKSGRSNKTLPEVVATFVKAGPERVKRAEATGLYPAEWIAEVRAWLAAAPKPPKTK